jgi:subtilase family serine protease
VRSSSGGGISTFYERPSYQSNLPDKFRTLFGNSVEAEGRLTPDVSFNAAIYGGALIFFGFFGTAGVWGLAGGTSAAGPAWAAIVGLLNQANGGPVGFINPTIYAMMQGNRDDSSRDAGPFHDITKGNNSDTAGAPCTPSTCGFASPPVDGFTAGKGWDMTTGWGTPDVANFIHSFIQFKGEDSRND